MILTESISFSNDTSNFKDRYELGDQLGWGQFGVIRVCSDNFSGEIFACKSIAKDRLISSDDVNSVKLEIEIMSKLSGHANIVDLKEVYEEEDYVHLVMELCAGGELFHLLEKKGKFSESESRVLFRQLMQVVLYCNENGVVHRDLKPENILLATKASSSPIKLADFGLATYIKPGKKLRSLVGSPFYIAPEVLSGSYDEAVDVWSAGVILYILLSGTPPFWGKTKSRIFDAVRAANLRFPSDPWSQISESAKDLIWGMLDTDPSQRLSPKQVLQHSWMKDDIQSLPISRHENELDEGSFLSAPFMSRSQDISFGAESPVICGTHSPSFASRSSFSSFPVEHLPPALPSFAFFYPSFCHEGREMEQEEIKRGVGLTGSSSTQMFGVHNKRNRTIGFGECDQLDYMGITESIIRWSSWTQISTSLRSFSLVCSSCGTPDRAQSVRDFDENLRSIEIGIPV